MPLPAPSGRQKLLAGLVERAQGGDRGAFEQLVIETSTEVYSLAYRLVGNEHDARDVVQEAYLRAFRAIGRFRRESAVSTWLYRITANCAATHLKRRPRTVSDDLDEMFEIAEARPERHPEEMAHRSEQRRFVIEALRELAVELRVVVVLHDIYDLSHEAIATELGISRAASKVRLHRARRRLRDVLIAVDESFANSSRHGDKPRDADVQGELIALSADRGGEEIIHAHVG